MRATIFPWLAESTVVLRRLASRLRSSISNFPMAVSGPNTSLPSGPLLRYYVLYLVFFLSLSLTLEKRQVSRPPRKG